MGLTTLGRLKDLLAEDPSRSSDEVNDHDEVRDPDPATSGDSFTASNEALTTFPTENQNDQLHLDALEGMKSGDEAQVEDATGGPDVVALEAANVDQTGRHAALSAFQAAVSAARQEAETQLAETVERIRSEAAEQYRAELTRVTEEADRRREQDVAEMRGTVEAEARATIEQDRQEAAEQHTAELARVREELEQQHADDLRRVQTTAVESFKALTGNLLGRV